MAEAGRSGLSHIWASSRHTRHQRSLVRAVGMTCSSTAVVLCKMLLPALAHVGAAGIEVGKT